MSIIPVLGIAALISGLNPCGLSILLLTIAFLFNIGRARAGILKVGGTYIAGIFVVYVLVGLGLLRTLQVFNIPNFVAKIGALALIVVGAVNLINLFFPAFPIKLKVPQAAHLRIAKLMERNSIPAALLLGVLVGLFEFPCSGGPYLLVLGLLHDNTTYMKGLAYLLFYNLMFVLPLIAVLLAAGNNVVLEKIQRWKKENARQTKLWSSLAMLALGVIILFVS
jgi:cytochrome c biogenesis protein CcdA